MMNIQAIENLSFTELKANRDSLIKDAMSVPAKDLAQRYIQARTDAKQRDEKLFEQGKRIAELESAIDQYKAALQTATKQHKETIARCEKALAAANQLIVKLREKPKE